MQRIKAKVIEKEYLSAEIIRFRLEPPLPIEFKAGQFMSMAVEGYIRRSYSMANSPVNNRYLETYTNVTPAGPGSKFINNSQVGDLVDVLVPLGKFLYQSKESRVCLFATGTGIVPFISMINHELFTERSGREIVLYHGVSFAEHLIEKENFGKLQQKHLNFKYIPVVSRPKGVWEGKMGRVTQFLVDLKSTDDVYICGGREAIMDVEQGALDNGVLPENIYYERFY